MPFGVYRCAWLGCTLTVLWILLFRLWVVFSLPFFSPVLVLLAVFFVQYCHVAVARSRRGGIFYPPYTVDSVAVKTTLIFL